MRTGIFIISLASALILNSCNSNKDKANADVPSNAINPDAVKNPATASENGNDESNLPVLQFEEESYDFETIEEGKSVAHQFKFKNTGKSDLVISSANGSCGCTVGDYPKDAIGPGKAGVINVTFNSKGKVGMQHKTVTIIANTIPNSKVLTITGEVVK